MHIHLNDQYHHGQTPVHQLDARVKVVLTFLFILTVSLTPMGVFTVYLLLLGLVWVVAFCARIDLGFLLKRSLVAVPFALAAITLPFTVAGQPLLQLPLGSGIIISQEGTIHFLSIVLKSWISVQMAVILVTVTPFSAILGGLQALRVPQPLLAIISFMYRYTFVLADEVLRLLRARSARSATIPGQRSGGTLLWRGQVAGRMAGSLMLRSFERSERIYHAMLSRGYQGQMRSFHHHHLDARDIAVLAASVFVLLFILLIAYRP